MKNTVVNFNHRTWEYHESSRRSARDLHPRYVAIRTWPAALIRTFLRNRFHDTRDLGPAAKPLYQPSLWKFETSSARATIRTIVRSTSSPFPWAFPALVRARDRKWLASHGEQFSFRDDECVLRQGLFSVDVEPLNKRPTQLRAVSTSYSAILKIWFARTPCKIALMNEQILEYRPL